MRITLPLASQLLTIGLRPLSIDPVSFFIERLLILTLFCCRFLWKFIYRPYAALVLTVAYTRTVEPTDNVHTNSIEETFVPSATIFIPAVPTDSTIVAVETNTLETAAIVNIPKVYECSTPYITNVTSQTQANNNADQVPLNDAIEALHIPGAVYAESAPSTNVVQV